DEPTNDLDIPTLETLEESLLDFPGAIVLITHDRCMMDRVCSEVLAVDEGKIYADYYQWKSHQKEDEPKVEKGKKAGPSISYAKKKEAEKVERKIAKLEGQLQQLNEQLAVNGEDPKALEKICSEIALLETQMTEQYLIWEGLLSN
nr:ABC transporter ATP-binding protein [bacterium]